MYDLIVVGGGPAGLTAALYGARKGLQLLLLTKELGGQVMWTRDIENYMGYQFITGPELMQKFDEQAKAYLEKGQVKYEAATALKKCSDGTFRVSTDASASYQGKSVIIATGKNPRPLNVPGEEEFKGRGVSYCATCDGPLYKGKTVAVVGGGNSALQAAAELSRFARKVYLADRSGYRADAIIIEKMEQAENIEKLHRYQAVAIEGDKTVNTFRMVNGEQQEVSLAVDGIFVEVGLNPNTDWLNGLVELNQRREIAVDCRNRTSVEGLFAAGDVTSGVDKQIVIAAGDGAKAALVASEYLMYRK